MNQTYLQLDQNQQKTKCSSWQRILVLLRMNSIKSIIFHWDLETMNLRSVINRKKGRITEVWSFYVYTNGEALREPLDHMEYGQILEVH